MAIDVLEYARGEAVIAEEKLLGRELLEDDGGYTR
jgi:hypothetical protein